MTPRIKSRIVTAEYNKMTAARANDLRVHPIRPVVPSSFTSSTLKDVFKIVGVDCTTGRVCKDPE
jgi:hypothetical protein